jgi:hypothetical protein
MRFSETKRKLTQEVSAVACTEEARIRPPTIARRAILRNDRTDSEYSRYYSIFEEKGGP